LGLQRAGHEVVLLIGTQGPVLERLQQAGLHCLYTPMYFTDKWHWFRYWRARRAMRRLIRQERPNLIHSNDLTTHQMVSDAARGMGIPGVCHHRFCYEPAFTDWLMKYGAEHHLFVSHALMADISNRAPYWQQLSRAVVHDGLPLPPVSTSEARREMRRTLDLDP